MPKVDLYLNTLISMAYGGKSGVFAEKVIYIPCIKG
jgi:hypothetical protein